MPDNAVRPTEERRGRISRRGSRESRWISSHADTLRGSRAPSRATESALSSAEERVPSTAPTLHNESEQSRLERFGWTYLSKEDSRIPPSIRDLICPATKGPATFQLCKMMRAPEGGDMGGKECGRCKDRPHTVQNVKDLWSSFRQRKMSPDEKRKLQEHRARTCIYCTLEEAHICNGCAGIKMK